MATEQSLIQDIAANPHEDAPRLALAEWLAKHGDPRGEFVRVQLARARGDDSLAAREKELLDVHGKEWLGALQELGQDWRFERGFVTVGDVSVDVFLENGEKLFRLAPLLDGLRLRGANDNRLWEILPAPYFKRLRNLDLSNNGLTDEDIAVFLNHVDPSFSTAFVGASLQGLNLSSNQITEGGIHYLCTACERAGVRLTTLGLADNRIEEKGAEYLACSSMAEKLRSLDIAGNAIGHGGVIWLVCPAEYRSNDYPKEGGLPRMTDLNVSRNRIGDNSSCDAPWRSASEGPFWIDFKHVNEYDDIGSCVNADQHQTSAEFAVLSIMRSPLRGQLQRLNLAGNDLGAAATSCFLEYYLIWYDHNTETWTGSARGFDWPQLTSLDLRDCSIDDETVRQRLKAAFGDRVQL